MIGELLPSESPTTSAPPATFTPTPTAFLAPCPGDCNGDRRVDVSELMTAININLRRSAPDCPAVDVNTNDVVTIGELIAAVVANLHGCAGA